jgi:hypothetical protein
LERRIREPMSDADDVETIPIMYENEGALAAASEDHGKSGGTYGVRGHD